MNLLGLSLSICVVLVICVLVISACMLSSRISRMEEEYERRGRR